MLSEYELTELNRFASTLWGNPQVVLKSTPGGFEFIDLQGSFDIFQDLFAGPLKYDKILVRKEYRIAFQELSKDKYYYGAYVTGQPGIGKTLFLIYILVSRLGNRQAVALQSPDAQPFYVLFKDKVTVHSLGDRMPLHESSPVWALSDSNADVHIPSATFRGVPDVIRVIQTTSPNSSRWKEWSKQTGAERYVMDIWSEEEIADLANLSGLNVERMLMLAREWGCDPRTLLSIFHKKDQDIKRMYRKVAHTAAGRSSQMMSAIVDANLPDDAPSAFFFVRPGRKKDSDKLSRMSMSVCVPTPTLRHLLGESLINLDNISRIQFYHSMSQNADTRSAAGFIFESWFHCFFSAGHTVECRWIHGLSGVTPICGITALLESTLLAPGYGQPPYYWIATKGFPGIDSALVLEDVIFAFQITIGPRHKTPEKGLRALHARLPTELKRLPWRMVFVGPENGSTKWVAGYWARQTVSFPGSRTYLPIGWCSVDPVQSGITYVVAHDESDPDIDVPEMGGEDLDVDEQACS